MDKKRKHQFLSDLFFKQIICFICNFVLNVITRCVTMNVESGNIYFECKSYTDQNSKGWNYTVTSTVTKCEM